MSHNHVVSCDHFSPPPLSVKNICKGVISWRGYGTVIVMIEEKVQVKSVPLQGNLLGLIEEFFDYLTVEKQMSKLTIRNYRHYLERFVYWLHNVHHIDSVNVEDLDGSLISKYRVWLSTIETEIGDQIKPVTQGYHVIAIRSFLKWLIKQRYEVLAPDALELPKQRDRRLEFLSADEVERLLDMPTVSDVSGLRDKAILEMLFSTGLRVSELVGLDREQINLDRGEFGVKGKGGKVRVVFLSKRAGHWIERYLSARDDYWEPLFINFRGSVSGDDDEEGDEMKKFDVEYGKRRRLTSRSVQRIVKAYAKKAKLPIEVTPHVMRHSFATDLLQAGADIQSVQEMLGHQHISTTQIYTHVTNKQLKQVHHAFHGYSATEGEEVK